MPIQLRATETAEALPVFGFQIRNIHDTRRTKRGPVLLIRHEQRSEAPGEINENLLTDDLLSKQHQRLTLPRPEYNLKGLIVQRIQAYATDLDPVFLM